LLVAVMNELSFNGLQATSEDKKQRQHLFAFHRHFHSTSSFNLMLHARPNGLQMDL
jgi:hypothetical protein